MKEDAMRNKIKQRHVGTSADKEQSLVKDTADKEQKPVKDTTGREQRFVTGAVSEKPKKKIFRWKWLIRVCVFLALMFGGYFLFRQLGLFGLKSKVETSILTSSQLEDVLQIDDLSVCKITYNGVATVYQKKHPDKVAYYVSYEAEVKASIHMDDISVIVQDVSAEGETKKIIVTLPQIQVKQIDVDIASLDYMFVKKSANTEDVSEEAYAACLGDAGMECRGNEQLLMKARENCEDMVKALLTPIIENQEEAYELIIQ